MAEQEVEQEISEEDRLLFEFEFVRRCTTHNMADRLGVLEFAELAGFDRLFDIALSQGAYGQMLKGYRPPNEEAYLNWLIEEGLVTDPKEYKVDQLA